MRISPPQPIGPHWSDGRMGPLAGYFTKATARAWPDGTLAKAGAPLRRSSQSPAYITKTLGERPRDPAGRAEWDKAVREIESYRLRYAVRNKDSVLGDPEGSCSPGRRGSRSGGGSSISIRSPVAWTLTAGSVEPRTRGRPSNSSSGR